MNHEDITMSDMESDEQDDDNHSLVASKHSDDDDNHNCSFNDYSHRSCTRYAPCNYHRHRYQSIDSTKLQPTKGDLRLFDEKFGHRLRYDGNRWRRICDSPGCLRCLRGKIFYDNWLCREHFYRKSKKSSTAPSEEVILLDGNEDKTSVDGDPSSKNDQQHRKPSTRQLSKKKLSQHKRGEIIFDENGKRQKYDGHSWRVLCENHLCPRIATKSGLCRLHRIPTRKRSSTEVAAPVEQTISEPPASSICTSSPEVPPSQSFELSQLKKGDIQLVRQQWNGTKWYSLCHYPNESCSRRSAGIKYQHLCHIHYKEYIDKQKNIANASESAATAKRSRRGLSPAQTQSKIFFDGSRPSISSMNNTHTDRTKQIEQTVQTEVTYSLNTTDLRDACIFVDEDAYPDDRPASPEHQGDIKHEELHPADNRLQLTAHALSCKLQIEKLHLPRS